MLSVIRSLLGDDLLVKYDSVFLKPAKTGGATPWHQDIALWRDDHVEAANAWIAIDPASNENGCMQFLPASHHGGLIDHILYEGGLHGELGADPNLKTGQRVFLGNERWRTIALPTRKIGGG